MRILNLAFGPERRRIVALFLLCGALMLSFGFEGPIIAGGVEAAELGRTRPDLAVWLLVVTVGYIWSSITTVRRVTENLLLAVSRARRRLVEQALASNLATVEQVGPESLLSALTVAPNEVLAAAPLLARAMRTGCYIVGTLIVMAVLDIQLLALMAGVLAVVFITLAANHGAVMRALGEASALEAQTREDLRAMVLGFKELRLNATRRAGMLARLHARSEAALVALRRANRRQATGFVLQASAMLVASGICIFVLPRLLPGMPIINLVTAAVLMSNISLALVRDIPLLTRGEVAVTDMERLYTELRPTPQPGAQTRTAPASPAPMAGAGLQLDALSYRYPDLDGDRGFALGPVSVTFERGSITFVLGGNSSGKTTLIKVLAGLYTPDFGTVSLDGQRLDPQALREQVSVIFADPYLFDRLYGWTDADPGLVNGLLDEIGLARHTRFADGRFTRVDLSTGQRKRLAWVVAMIEARPILLLDQWAADQDPEFREHFYRVMLPALRAAGRTVIAVTNDDRYYDVADRLLRLEDGLLTA